MSAARGRRIRSITFPVAAILTATLFAVHPAHAAHPNALWRVVHQLCVPAKRLLDVSTPCVEVDLKRGVAVVPDPKRATHLLLVPTRRLVGIESADLQAADAPNYWADAWDARPLLERRVGRPLEREDVGLAVNSRFGRSQEQLHIHIACVRPDVRRSLDAQADRFSADAWKSWSLLPDRRYRVRLIRGEALGEADPFRILAQTDPRAAAKMSWQTLVVLGAKLPDGSPGFYLLSDRISWERNDSGHGEELLDHKCRAESGALPS